MTTEAKTPKPIPAQTSVITRGKQTSVSVTASGNRTLMATLTDELSSNVAVPERIRKAASAAQESVEQLNVALRLGLTTEGAKGAA